MQETVLAAIAAYIGTNMDDMIINMLFFAQAGSLGDVYAIVLGKYLGISALVLLSTAGAVLLSFLPARIIALLGVLPIMLGVKAWLEESEDEQEETKGHRRQGVKGMLLTAALITIANGADNIGVYLPLFAGFSSGQMAAALAVFAVMTAVWCAIGKKLSSVPSFRDLLLRHKHSVVPLIYILLGIYILGKGWL